MRRLLMRAAPAALLVCMACATVGAVAGAPAQAQVRVDGATLRAPRPGFTATTISLKLQTSSDARLVGARLEGAKAVELRAMVREGSVVTAVPVPSVDLPAGVPVELRLGPGAFHLLALKLQAPVAPHSQPRLWLEIQDAGSGKVRSVQTRVHVLPSRGVHADDEH